MCISICLFCIIIYFNLFLLQGSHGYRKNWGLQPSLLHAEWPEGTTFKPHGKGQCIELLMIFVISRSGWVIKTGSHIDSMWKSAPHHLLRIAVLYWIWNGVVIIHSRSEFCDSNPLCWIFTFLCIYRFFPCKVECKIWAVPAKKFRIYGVTLVGILLVVADVVALCSANVCLENEKKTVFCLIAASGVVRDSHSIIFYVLSFLLFFYFCLGMS
jgi:hypothetical protein